MALCGLKRTHPVYALMIYVFAFADQRITPQMRLFNALARSVLSPLAQQAPLFLYVNTFDMLQAVMDALSDNAHLTDFNAALLPSMHFCFRAACTGE